MGEKTFSASFVPQPAENNTYYIYIIYIAPVKVYFEILKNYIRKKYEDLHGIEV